MRRDVRRDHRACMGTVREKQVSDMGTGRGGHIRHGGQRGNRRGMKALKQKNKEGKDKRRDEKWKGMEGKNKVLWRS